MFGANGQVLIDLIFSYHGCLNSLNFANYLTKFFEVFKYGDELLQTQCARYEYIITRYLGVLTEEFELNNLVKHIFDEGKLNPFDKLITEEKKELFEEIQH